MPAKKNHGSNSFFITCMGTIILFHTHWHTRNGARKWSLLGLFFLARIRHEKRKRKRKKKRKHESYSVTTSCEIIQIHHPVPRARCTLRNMSKGQMWVVQKQGEFGKKNAWNGIFDSFRAAHITCHLCHAVVNKKRCDKPSLMRCCSSVVHGTA